MSWWRSLEPWLSFKPAVKALIRLGRFSDWSESSCLESWLSFKPTVKALIRLGRFLGWSESSCLDEGAWSLDYPSSLQWLGRFSDWSESSCLESWLSFKPAMKALIRLGRFSFWSESSCLDEGAWSLDYPSSLQWRLWLNWAEFSPVKMWSSGFCIVSIASGCFCCFIVVHFHMGQFYCCFFPFYFHDIFVKLKINCNQNLIRLEIYQGYMYITIQLNLS